MPEPGDTRWLSADKAVCTIDSFYEEIGAVLCEIAKDANEKYDICAIARRCMCQYTRSQIYAFVETLL